MNRELDRMLRDAGAILVKVGRHAYYELDGQKFALHVGTKPNPREFKATRSKLRQILKARSAKK